jgi:hypothetical protein
MAMLHGTASSRLELSFECSKLADADLLSKSDPAILLFSRGSMVASWDYLGQTGARERRSRLQYTAPGGCAAAIHVCSRALQRPCATT